MINLVARAAHRGILCYDGASFVPEEVCMEAQKGDRITVESNKVGGAIRTGEVVEVIHGSTGAADHYLVRWEDGRQTTFFPSSDTHVAPG